MYNFILKKKYFENKKMVVPNSNPLETKLFQLMADKQKLESQINSFGDVLAQVFYIHQLQ